MHHEFLRCIGEITLQPFDGPLNYPNETLGGLRTRSHLSKQRGALTLPLVTLFRGASMYDVCIGDAKTNHTKGVDNFNQLSNLIRGEKEENDQIVESRWHDRQAHPQGRKTWCGACEEG